MLEKAFLDIMRRKQTAIRWLNGALTQIIQQYANPQHFNPKTGWARLTCCDLFTAFVCSLQYEQSKVLLIDPNSNTEFGTGAIYHEIDECSM